MLTICLRSDDELFHVTIYSWLLSVNVNMAERVVEVRLSVYRVRPVITVAYTIVLFTHFICFFYSPVSLFPQIQSSYIEEFLRYTSTLQQHDDSMIFDLLWKYYEKNRNYLAAAKILDQLAHRNR